jgi:hypothetical protein
MTARRHTVKALGFLLSFGAGATMTPPLGASDRGRIRDCEKPRDLRARALRRRSAGRG